MTETPKRRWLTELREGCSLNQERLAEKVGVHPVTVSRWERGIQGIYLRHRRPLAEALRVGLDELNRFEAAYEASTMLPSAQSPEADVIDSPRFDAALRNAAALTTMGMPAGLQDLLRPPQGLGPASVEDLQLMAMAAGELERRDAAHGGGAALDMAITLHDRVISWLRDPSPVVAGALQTLDCELAALIGWLAYDAGRPTLARRYVNDTMASARFADAVDADLRAMNTMCLLLSDSDRPAEALQCAHHAQRTARGHAATPRTIALLHVRTARTHAKRGDPEGFRRELDLAADHLHRADARSDDDPAWVSFLDRAELAAVIGGSHLLLHQPDQAVAAYQSAVEHSSDGRNAISRILWLAEALLRQGDVSQASSTAHGVVGEMTGLASARVVRRLHRLRRVVDPHTSAVPAAADFAEAYDEVFVA